VCETVEAVISRLFFVSKSMPDSEVITVWRLRGHPDTRLVCPIELEGS
jgi:hypothetical protein